MQNLKKILKSFLVLFVILTSGCDNDDNENNNSDKKEVIVEKEDDQSKNNKDQKEFNDNQSSKEDTEFVGKEQKDEKVEKENNNMVTVNFSTNDLLGKNYEEVEKKLNEYFTNVKVYYSDENLTEENIFNVLQVTIDGVDNFNKGDKFTKDAEVEVIFSYFDIEKIPYHIIEDSEMYIEREYNHYTDGDNLGWNEHATIYLTLYGENLDANDVEVYDSCGVMSVNLEDEEKIDGGIVLTYDAFSNDEGHADVIIDASFEKYINFSSALYEPISFNCLDDYEGSLVYFTRNGERYHFSAECAGVNAEAGLLREIESFGYTPCGKCS